MGRMDLCLHFPKFQTWLWSVLIFRGETESTEPLTPPTPTPYSEYLMMLMPPSPEEEK